MSTTADLITAIKRELKSAHMTYADLARAMGMAESSVKRMLAKGDMSMPSAAPSSSISPSSRAAWPTRNRW
jgi:transcriptional regulator with XRE-family HTH domain